MFPKSLALVTELGVLAPRARITYRNDCVVVETPDEPGWSDGNFLLLPHAMAAGELPRWIARFVAELGPHRAVSLRCDDTSGRLGDEDELRAAGFTVDVHELLVADEISTPSSRPVSPIRALTADELVATTELAWSIGDRHDEGYRAFLTGYARSLASLVASGRAHFVGAFDGDALIASLGVVPLGTVARYQQVQTCPAYRQRGLASCLLALAAERCTGVERFAILSDPGSAAARMYRRAGFRAAELTGRALRFDTTVSRLSRVS